MFPGGAVAEATKPNEGSPLPPGGAGEGLGEWVGQTRSEKSKKRQPYRHKKIEPKIFHLLKY